VIDVRMSGDDREEVENRNKKQEKKDEVFDSWHK
jgi:hypothetical protein